MIVLDTNVISEIMRPHPSRVGRATVLSLPDISAFDKGTAVGKSIVVPIFNYRNVGHKQHARPTRLPNSVSMGILSKRRLPALLG